MKRIIKTSFILLALLGVLFTSCKKEYERPPIQNLPQGKMYTIGELLALPANTTFDTASVCGIVTADEQSGNLYKTIFIQDRASGRAIELLLNTSSAARIGDSVRVFLDKNIMVNNYHNLPQLVGKDGKGFNPDGHLIIYPKNKIIEPTTVTIADIKGGGYTAALVRLENVEFVDQGSAFCNVGENTNRNLKDATGELIVRTSNYANFAYDPLPSGQGSLVAIASVYNNDWQLIIRSKTEMNFEGGGGTVNPPAPAGETQSLPYSQSFATEFGSYTTYNVTGPEAWMIDYSTAKMTGYVSGSYSENEDWLISSPVAITDVTDAKMTMVYIARLFNNVNEEITVWASSDYKFGDDPTTASWTQVPSTLSESSNWSDFKTVELALTPYVGQTVSIAIKYLSSSSKAGTIEVKSITIEQGTAGGVTPPVGVVGDGSRNNPYSADDIIALGITTSDGNKYWVKDHIAGFIDSGYNYQFSADGASASNLTIAKADFTSSADCVPVQLPVGAVRDGLNLADNPNNLSQEVLLYGTLDSYFKVPGVKNVTYAEINGNSFGVDPEYVPPVPTGELQDLPYEQSFATEFGTYFTYNVTGAQTWVIDYSSANMTGHTGGNGGPNYDNEDWLISAPFKVSATNVPVVKMEYVGCYFDSNENISEDITLWVSSDYNFGESPVGANWLQVPCDLVNSTSWTFQTVEVDLSILGQLVSETATLAVKYVSSTGRAGTIEIKTITIEEGTGVNPNPPDDPPTPIDPSETVDVATALTLQGSGNEIWVRGFIVGAVKKNKMATSNDNIDWEAPFTGDRAVLLSDDINATDITNCIVVELPANTELRTQVNLKDNPGNLRRNLSVKGTPDAYLSHEGLKGCPGTVDDFELDQR